MILTPEVWQTVGIVAGQIVALLVVTGLLGWLLRLLFNALDARTENPGAAKGLTTARRLTRNLLRLVGGALFLSIVGLNGYLIVQGEDLLAFYRGQLAQIGPDFWTRLGFVEVPGAGRTHMERRLT